MQVQQQLLLLLRSVWNSHLSWHLNMTAAVAAVAAAAAAVAAAAVAAAAALRG